MWKQSLRSCLNGQIGSKKPGSTGRFQKEPSSPLSDWTVFRCRTVQIFEGINDLLRRFGWCRFQVGHFGRVFLPFRSLFRCLRQ
jgi:hypothetical protein